MHGSANGSANGYANGYTNGYANGFGNGTPAEDPHVWYRSPSGESPSVPTSFEPSAHAPATNAPSTYDATSFESAYAPAPTQSFPTTPAVPAGTADVTSYDPVTGLPRTGDPIVYPMRNVAGRMAMVFGVLAIVCTSVLFPLFPLAFFFAVTAIVLGRRGRLRARYGFASNPGAAGGGFALGVVAMVLVVLWSALATWLCLTYSATDMKNCVQDTHNAPEAIRCFADVVDAA